RLVKDAKIIKEQVVAGTVAETMANAMASNYKSSRNKDLVKEFFVNYAAQVLKNSLNYVVQ
ncbi:hypothetical protein DFQ28_002722, partial [Apophysomyces sp. BC1034]